VRQRKFACGCPDEKYVKKQQEIFDGTHGGIARESARWREWKQRIPPRIANQPLAAHEGVSAKGRVSRLDAFPEQRFVLPS
jgi:hypothetical protein